MQGDQIEGWLFPSRKSKSGRFELGALQRKFRAIARSLNIPDDLKLYCARHTFGTMAMAEFKDPSLVRDMMGHEDLKTKLDHITADDVESLRLPGSASNANCALRTLRRMLHKAEEWKLIFRIPKFRLMKEHGRSLTLDAALEAKLIGGARLCRWRKKSFNLFHDVLVLMRNTGMRNERELFASGLNTSIEKKYRSSFRRARLQPADAKFR